MYSEWKNYGDINFTEYGGLLIRADRDAPDIFQVFSLTPIPGMEDIYHAALCTVDVSDSWIDWEAVFNTCGYKYPDDLTELSGYEQAGIAMNEYGVENFCPVVIKNGRYISYPCNDDFFFSKKETINFMKEIGAEEFI